MLLEATLTTGVSGLILGYGAYCCKELKKAKIARIRRYSLPEEIRLQFFQRNPEIPEWAWRHIWHALSDYFCATVIARHHTQIPSVMASKLWETFAHTSEYASFCEAVLGQHLPHEATSLRTPCKFTSWEEAGPLFHEVWRCLQHPHLKPKTITVAPEDATPIPLLFVVDSMHCPEGFRFSPAMFTPV